MHNKFSNNVFDNTSAPLSYGVAKFLIKRRNGIIWTPARKHIALNEGDGIHPSCPKIDKLKYYINCYISKLASYTYRHDNVEEIMAQAINNHNP
jgi:hypothetical protein